MEIHSRPCREIWHTYRKVFGSALDAGWAVKLVTTADASIYLFAPQGDNWIKPRRAVCRIKTEKDTNKTCESP